MAVRVVTYNIHCAIGVSRVPRIRAIAQVLRALEPDVIGLNEVVRTPILADQPALLGRMLGMEHSFQRTTRSHGMAFGNAVLVRGSILAGCGAMLSEGPLSETAPLGSTPPASGPSAGMPPRGVEPRGLLLVDARVDGHRFVFGSTHLAPHPEARAHQMRTLAAYLANKSRSEVPFVLAGDFNAQPHALAPLRELLELAKPQATYPSQSPRTAIDHVFFSNHWRCTRAFAVPAPASDHAALVVDLEPATASRRGGSSVY